MFLAERPYLKPHVTKKQVPDKDKMNLSNNNIYEIKCYINLFYVVSEDMEPYLP